MNRLNLVEERFIAVRLNKETGGEFFDWDTLAYTEKQAKEFAARDDYRAPAIKRRYPVARIARGRFVESG